MSLILQRSHINNMRNPGFFVAWIVGGISFLFYGLIYLGLRTSNLVQRVQSGDIPTGDTTSIDYWDSQRSFIFQIITAIVFLQLETLTSGIWISIFSIFHTFNATLPSPTYFL